MDETKTTKTTNEQTLVNISILWFTVNYSVNFLNKYNILSHVVEDRFDLFGCYNQQTNWVNVFSPTHTMLRLATPHRHTHMPILNKMNECLKKVYWHVCKASNI